MKKDRMSREIDEVIANGNRIIREAEEALAESERRFAEMKFDPRAALAHLKRVAGDAAGLQVEAEAAATVQRIHEALHGKQNAVTARPPTRRTRMRDMI